MHKMVKKSILRGNLPTIGDLYRVYNPLEEKAKKEALLFSLLVAGVTPAKLVWARKSYTAMLIRKYGGVPDCSQTSTTKGRKKGCTAGKHLKLSGGYPRAFCYRVIQAWQRAAKALEQYKFQFEFAYAVFNAERFKADLATIGFPTDGVVRKRRTVQMKLVLSKR